MATPAYITRLEPNEIFVFGSNLSNVADQLGEDIDTVFKSDLI